MRILLLLLAVGALFAVPALLFEGWIDAERVLSLFQSQSPWVAMFGIAAICADLFIPFPAQAIMTLFGENYGWFVGGLLATAGTFCAGLLAFELCRLMGQKMVVIIAGKRGLARFQVFFLRYGFWAIVVSRWLPAAAEALASLAGATRMGYARFILSNLLGSLLVGFAYAGLGAMHSIPSYVSFGLSVVLPIAMLAAFIAFILRSQQGRQ